MALQTCSQQPRGSRRGSAALPEVTVETPSSNSYLSKLNLLLLYERIVTSVTCHAFQVYGFPDNVEMSAQQYKLVQARTAKLLRHTFLENLTSPDILEHTLGGSKAIHASCRRANFFVTPQLSRYICCENSPDRVLFTAWLAHGFCHES